MFGYGGNGCGSGLFGRGGNCNNGAAESMLLQAINAGSATAQRDIDRLASAMGCGQAEMRNGLTVLQQSLCQIANTLGMTVPQIVNAIQAGDGAILSKMSECCCENRLALCQQNNLITTGFAQAGFQAQQDKQEILNRLDAIERAHLAAENDALKRQLDRDNLSAAVSTLLQNNNGQTVAVSALLNQILERLPKTTATTTA
ncbi:hypothetical protein NB636_01245 [Oxalobacter aliiformigenes]|uniref:hypothetical protein n=1 Tax=Oxalobacter aliiformigenes TaxID=2946593 RepID=UPI0022AECB5B|nr:hypothetical protein [Oxalobacter aliiformigenes]MCZ4064141.1 hypothetical protein [Oxalobacter aliiformigenes]WAV99517.1 hypothetical protein NB636_01245 [Oxalobacter aliiformigenes]